MVIKKILNNNVVISEDENQAEVVIMGKGIAYAKKIGDDVDVSMVDKSFVCEKKEELKHFAKLLSEVDLQEFEFTKELIDFAKSKINKKLNNAIYITLTDHINTLKQRAEVGAYIDNIMLWDIKRLYREEFDVAVLLVEKINDKLASRYDDNEAASIAMHFVNAEFDTDSKTVSNITKVMAEILNIVKYHFKIVYKEESLGYYRFTTHLRFFSQRIFSGHSYNGKEDDELFQMIKSKYPDVYECTLIIRDFLSTEYQYDLENEECLYLTIHIAKVIRESELL